MAGRDVNNHDSVTSGLVLNSEIRSVHFLFRLDLTLMLLLANFANTKLYKKSHLGVLSECFPMDTNMTGFRQSSKIFVSLCFGQKKPQHWKG